MNKQEADALTAAKEIARDIINTWAMETDGYDVNTEHAVMSLHGKITAALLKASDDAKREEPVDTFETGLGWVKCHDGERVIAFLNYMPDRAKHQGKRYRVEFYRLTNGETK